MREIIATAGASNFSSLNKRYELDATRQLINSAVNDTFEMHLISLANSITGKLCLYIYKNTRV